MSDSSQPLFRREVARHQRDAWLGPILLIRPPEFAWLTAFTAAVAMLALGYLYFGEYTKKARVTGYLVPELGVLKLVAPQAGVIAEKHVREGQVVHRGDVLFVLAVDRTNPATTQTTQAAVARQLDDRQASLRAERELSRQQALQQDSLLAVRIRGLRSALDQVDREIATQRRRVESAATNVERYRKLLADRFVSDAQVQQRSDELLDQQGRLQALERDRLAIERDAQAAAFEREQAPLRLKVALAGIDRNISELEQQRAESDARAVVAITAPSDGVGTAILGEAGQTVSAAATLGSIVPQDARLQAQLFAPSRAIGFIEPGRKVLLRYNAYPYQKFGQYSATVRAISRSPIAAADIPLAVSADEPLYRITVDLERQVAMAYGEEQPLQAGMQLEADVLLDRRRLIEWVFEPLYSLVGRV